MKTLKTFALLFVLTVLPVSAQLGPDGTGFVNGYRIGPLANLIGSDLSNTDLSFADLRHADLSAADLRGANLFRANLIGSNLRFANLSWTNLSWTNLRDADPKETTTIVMGTYGFAYLVARRSTSGCRRSGFRGVGSVTAVLPAAGGY